MSHNQSAAHHELDNCLLCMNACNKYYIIFNTCFNYWDLFFYFTPFKSENGEVTEKSHQYGNENGWKKLASSIIP